ncbi:hypothetical protein AS034_13715 [[Bacillus] enclensis]|nr:hypothetical protein AS034_13715 [[Bacillus] enclensis]
MLAVFHNFLFSQRSSGSLNGRPLFFYFQEENPVLQLDEAGLIGRRGGLYFKWREDGSTRPGLMSKKRPEASL